MNTLFYLSPEQIMRIKPYFPLSTVFPELMTGVSLVGSSPSSNTAYNGKMLRVNMDHTKLSTIALSAGVAWEFLTKSLRNSLSKTALQHV